MTGAEIGEAEPVEVASVYVHAPFCARRCTYCDFAVHVRRDGDVDEWIETVGAELCRVELSEPVRVAARLDTLYVGGGTPSLMGPTAMARLRDLLGAERIGRDTEWTAEANPESLTPALASAWREAGVNRLSIGVQTFHEPTLRWMGRLHGATGAEHAVSTARSAGFDNLSVDLIFGLPRHLGRSWRADLERVVELAPAHVSLYGLTVESGTPLGRDVALGRESPVDEEQYREEFLEAAETFTSAGYDHYEVSNFAREGARSLHNSAYWRGVPYLGLGNGAHSFLPPVRRWNVRDWTQYRGRSVRGESPEEGRERLDADARRLEEVWLRLRTDRGWPRAGAHVRVNRLLDGWIANGWAQAADSHVILTPDGWLVMDGLTVELDQASSG